MTILRMINKMTAGLPYSPAVIFMNCGKSFRDIQQHIAVIRTDRGFSADSRLPFG